MRAPKKVHASVAYNPTIYLRWDNGDWGKMTFQETQHDGDTWWTVALTSSWGSWDYSWSRKGMGKSIYNFLTKDRHDYIVRNMMAKLSEKYDHEGTCKNIRKLIKEEYPNYWRDKDEVDELRWQEKSFRGHDVDSFDSFYYTLRSYPALDELMGEEPWHYIQSNKSKSAHFFFNKMFPKFYPEIKKLAKLQKEPN